jgi:hypothetical protein
MQSSGTLRGVAIARTDVSEERMASIIRMIRIGELGTTLAVTSNRRPLRRKTVSFSQCIRSELGVRGSVVVKALCYKPEGRGFETR